MAESPAVRRWPRRLATLAIVLALFAPVMRDRDGLPLSTYPMYAGARDEQVSFVRAVGVDVDGEYRSVDMATIALTRDPLVAQSFLNDGVDRGEAAAMCAEIAGRADRELAAIEIVTEVHDVARRTPPEAGRSRTLHASCPVAPAAN